MYFFVPCLATINIPRFTRSQKCLATLRIRDTAKRSVIAHTSDAHASSRLVKMLATLTTTRKQVAYPHPAASQRYHSARRVHCECDTVL